MRRILFATILAALVAMCPTLLWAADQKPGTLENLVEEEIWIIFAHDPAGYLHDAWENFIDGDIQDAALTGQFSLKAPGCPARMGRSFSKKMVTVQVATKAPRHKE